MDRRVDGLTLAETCRQYQDKVTFIAQRVHRRLVADAAIPVEDLAAIGSMGLMEAFDRFEPDRGIRFGTFAEYRIRGAMYDAMRRSDPFTRRRRQLSKRIGEATRSLQRVDGRLPRAAEVADALGLGLDAYHAAIGRTMPATHVPLDRPGPNETPACAERLADPRHPADEALGDQELHLALDAAVQRLPERQREAVVLYYREDRTLSDIALLFGVTTSRVCQILTEARARLKERLAALAA